MRIGLIAYGLDRQTGGIGRYTSELTRALRDRGIDLVVLNAGRAAVVPGVHVLRGSRLLPALLTIGQIEIARSVQRLGLDLVHDPTGVMPLMLTGAGRVATIHDVIPYVHPAASTWLDWLIYHAWLPLAVRRLDRVITDSQQSRADILRYLPIRPERLAVVSAGVSPSYRPLDQAQCEPVLARNGIAYRYILYVGAVESRKNLVRLLEAYARLLAWSQNWRLVVVGARHWRASAVAEAVHRLGLEEKVLFTGYVAEGDLPALYSGADLFVFPSLYEGFGLPVLEAMACGAPVITSNVSSLPEVAGDAALLVDPLNSEAITAAMQQVLADGDLRADLRVQGLKRAAGFNWQRTAEETIAVYQQVLG